MRAVIFGLALIFVMGLVYPLKFVDDVGTNLTAIDVSYMAREVEALYGFKVNEVHVYSENGVNVYEFSGYKEVSSGYVTREVPYSVKLDEYLNPIQFHKEKEDKIGFKAVFLGMPGIISYILCKAVGLL